MNVMNYKLTVKKVACALSVLVLYSLFFATYAGKGKGNAPAQQKIEVKQIDAQKAVVIKVTVPSGMSFSMAAMSLSISSIISLVHIVLNQTI
jgi:hypothetical protein